MAKMTYGEARAIASILKRMDDYSIPEGRFDLWKRLVRGGFLITREYKPLTFKEYEKRYGWESLPIEAQRQLRKLEKVM